MKKSTLLLFEMLFFVVLANAQRVWFVPTIEKTVAGNQYGAHLLFENKSQWSIGAFYQTSWQQTSDGMRTANPFYGITINAPLVKSDRINFYFNVRGGVVNQHFLVVAPAFETRLKVTRKICLAALMSVRMTYPSAALKIYLTI